MSYIRGDYYVWTDSEDWIHIWSRDGYDGWDDTIWASNDEGTARAEGFENASGISIPIQVLDHLVMMRLAELLEAKGTATAIDASVGYGNVGGQALERHVDTIKGALAKLEEAIAQNSDERQTKMNGDQGVRGK